MSRPARVVGVVHLGGHRLRLTFSDGLVRELDLGAMLVGGVFAAVEDEESFGRVAVDPVAGTICWADGVDLDPDVLHGDFPPASGETPVVLREFRLRQTG